MPAERDTLKPELQRRTWLGERPLLVADRDLVRLPLWGRVQATLPGVPAFSEVTPDPTVAAVDALAAHLRSARHDVVVAVAGGSVLNCAKAAACLAAGDLSSIRAVHSEGVPQGKIDKHGFGPAHVAAACRRLTAEKH